MRVPKSVAALTDTEKLAYRDAVLKLKNDRPSLIPAAQTDGATSRWDDYVWIHMVVGLGAHRGAAFAPWHREFLRQLEFDLREASGNDQLCIPYWDWTTARVPADPGWPFTANLMGEMGSGTDNRVPPSSPFGGQPVAADNQWVLTVLTGAPGGGLDGPRDNTSYLRRKSPGGSGGGVLTTANSMNTTLTRTVYDAASFTEGGAGATPADLPGSFRKSLEYACHNGPHGWVGGSMEPMTSPNDPVFFLHHCNVDRLWATWQQKHPTAGYLPTGSAGAHALDGTMSNLDPTRFNYPVLRRPSELIDFHALGVWYDTDLPIVTLDAASVNFGNVPDGLTTYRPVEFTVHTGRRVNFRITGLGGAGFSIPPEQGSVVPVDPNPVGDITNGEVFIAYTNTVPGPAAIGSVAIEAYIVDTQGFYAAAPGQEFVVGAWPMINLVATPVARQRNVVSLVLDRSGSMSAPAGGTGTRAQLLRTAVQVFTDLMAPTDGLGIVTYDDVVDRVLEVTALGAASPPGTGRQAVANLLAGNALDPRGLTGIGSGIIEAADVLADGVAAATPPYDVSAMVVMTDGNQNVTPNVQDPSVQAVLTTRTFAVGLGRAGQVSDTVLGAIAGGTGAYQLVTGDVSAAAQRFKLSKYFVQVLAGITNAQVIVDPDGDLALGVVHRVPFEVSAADVRIDAILLSPAAPYIQWGLEAPDGTVISAASLTVNSEFVTNREDTFFRVGLPADPAAPSGTHAGTWHALLTIDRRAVSGSSTSLSHAAERPPVALLAELQKGLLPYSLLVHASSNMQFRATVVQTSGKPGAEVKVVGELIEYDQPLRGRAEVLAQITRPSGHVDKLSLRPTGTGRFEGSFTTVEPGVYAVRLMARASATRGGRVPREETRTVSVFDQRGDDRPDDRTNADDRWLDVVRCLLGDANIDKVADRLGLDPDRVRKCLDSARRSVPVERIEPSAQRATRAEPSIEDLVKLEVATRMLSEARDIEDLGVRRAVEQHAVIDPEPVMDAHHHVAFLPVFEFDGDEPRLLIPDIPQHGDHDTDIGPARRSPAKRSAAKKSPAKKAPARKSAKKTSAAHDDDGPHDPPSGGRRRGTGG